LPEKAAVTSHRFAPGYYRSLVEEDAKKVGLPKDQTKALWGANAYFAEFSGSQLLKVGASLETTHLRLQAVSDKVWVGEEGQGYRTEHLVLQLANRTDKYLAYRVLTEVSGRCRGKGILSHNAFALKPSEEIRRTECILTRESHLTVKRVEALEISPLGYYYVSQLDPQGLRLDARTSEGHQTPPQLGPCRLIPWRRIQHVLERGEAVWYDVLDFYSRHGCNEYTYFLGYRWSEKAPRKLPVEPPRTE
jgi:hypothetical protein